MIFRMPKEMLKGLAPLLIAPAVLLAGAVQLLAALGHMPAGLWLTGIRIAFGAPTRYFCGLLIFGG